VGSPRQGIRAAGRPQTLLDNVHIMFVPDRGLGYVSGHSAVPRAPVLVEDLGAVTGRDGAHGLLLVLHGRWGRGGQCVRLVILTGARVGGVL
jgi:hypothetical protein